MRAVGHRTHGGPDVLEMVERPDPRPGPHEAVVEVRAAALNRLDVLQRVGPPLIPGFSLPHVPGMDIAGDVTAVGPEVDRVGVGARVLVKAGIRCGTCPPCVGGEIEPCPNGQLIGGNRDGGYAEQVVVPAGNLLPVPAEVSHVEAASFSTAYPISWHALMRTGRLERGETIVIHAAGSGLGVFAIQIAKQAGATVIATSRSATKLARATELGADVVIDTTKADLAEEVKAATDGRGADIVFDHLGPALFMASLRSLRYGGRMVVCGTTTGAVAEVLLPAVYQSGLSILGARVPNTQEYHELIGSLWGSEIRGVVDTVLPLADAPEAHRRLETGDFFGKIVLEP